MSKTLRGSLPSSAASSSRMRQISSIGFSVFIVQSSGEVRSKPCGVQMTGTSRSFEEKFWVDMGALYFFVPEKRLEQMGIRPLRSRDLKIYSHQCLSVSIR